MVGVTRRLSAPNHWRIAHLVDRITPRPADLLDQLSLTRLVDEVRPHEIYNLAANVVRARVVGPAAADRRVQRAGRHARPGGDSAGRHVDPRLPASSSEMFGKVRETPQTERGSIRAAPTASPRSSPTIAQRQGASKATVWEVAVKSLAVRLGLVEPAAGTINDATMSARACGARRQRGCLRERPGASSGEPRGRTGKDTRLGGGGLGASGVRRARRRARQRPTASPPCGPAARLGAWRRRLMNEWMRHLNRPQPQNVRCAAAQRRLLPGGRASRPAITGRPAPAPKVASVMVYPAGVPI